jgi:hypothetical protein
MASAASTAASFVFETWKAVSVDQCHRPLKTMRVNTLRSTRTIAAMCGCHSVVANSSAGSKTVTMRRSSRLRPLVRLPTASIGAVAAAISWSFWFSVG